VTQRFAHYALLLSLAVGALPAAAEVERFAVLIGNNVGDEGDVPLTYAERDAERMANVLQQLGGFPAQNVVTLSGRTADQVRGALIATNQRVRAAASKDGVQPMLFVYYSGHADAQSLHLDGSRLPLEEIEQLVEGSAAEVRLLVVDSCRSGALTRVKGGREVEAFPIQLGLDDRLASEGFVVLTSAAAGEDAQESDDIQASFFSHFLLSGLRGAADDDGDGRVVLVEAYQYAYDHTLRASSRTLAGTQHPTFRYDLRGRGDVVLTQLRADDHHATLALPAGATYLVLAGSEEGEVVAEVGKDDAGRRLVLRPGSYWLRGRTKDALLEGDLELSAGQALTLDPATLSRTDYARLVRKGSGHGPTWVSGPTAALLVHGPRDDPRFYGGATAGWCPGVALGWPIELRWLTLSPRADVCWSDSTNLRVDIATTEASLSLNAGYTFDLPLVSLGLYAGAGVIFFWQRFTTVGSAPDRLSTGGAANLGATFSVDLVAGTYVFADAGVRGLAYLGEGDALAEQVAPQLRLLPIGALGAGWRF
jgi:hypothetical protein